MAGVALSAALLVVTGSPVLAATGWLAESPGGPLDGRALASVLHAGELHVFGTTASGGLGHGVRAGNGTWSSQVLDPGGSSGSDVAVVSVAGELHTFSRPMVGTGVRHVWWGPDAAWHAETLDQAGSAGTALAATAYYGQVQVFGARNGGSGLRQLVLDPSTRAVYVGDVDVGGSSGATAVTPIVLWGELHLFGAMAAGPGIRQVLFSPALGRWLTQDLEVGTSSGSHVGVAFGLGELHLFAPPATPGGGLRHAVYVTRSGAWLGQDLGSTYTAGANPVAKYAYGELHVFDAAPGAGKPGVGHLVYSVAAQAWLGHGIDAGGSLGTPLVAPVQDGAFNLFTSADGALRHVRYQPQPAGLTVAGRGWGHGVGMSQYGAAGWARRGASATDIVAHYYRGTALGSAPAFDQLRIGLGHGQSRISGSVAQPSAAVCSGTGAVLWFQGGFSYATSGGVGQVSTPQGSIGCTTPLWVNYGAPNGDVYLDNTARHYRHGTLELSVGDGAASVRAVMVLFAEGAYAALDVYLYGLGEMPSSWPAAALQAQAYAGRSYAAEKVQRLGQHRGGCDCALTATTSDQAYVGYDKEAEAGYGHLWVAAVRATAGLTVTYGGATIAAYYSASSGGFTENIENVWGGSPLPYLTAVPDPYDAESNPNAVWTKTLSWSQLEAALNATAATAVGTLADVTPGPGTGVSGRPVYMTIRGSGGTKVVRSSVFQAALGLKSTLFALVWI